MPQPTAWPIKGNIHTGDRYVLTEKFLRKPGINGDINSATEGTREIANPDFEILGANAASADQVFSANGGVVLTTAGAATDSVIVLPHLDTTQTAWSGVTWLPSKKPILVANIVTPAAVTNVGFWVGWKLTNTYTVATDADQAFFRYDDAVSQNWYAITSVAGTDVSTDTGVAVAVSTLYRLWIVIDGNRIAHYWINGVRVHSSAAALTASAAFIPYVGCISDTDATAKTLTLRELECSIAVS